MRFIRAALFTIIALSGTSNLKAQAASPVQHDHMPQFKYEGLTLPQFLAKNMNYPSRAKQDCIQGKVLIRFLVTAEGTVDTVQIVHSVNPLLDKEARRVISATSGYWNAGVHNGKPVSFFHTMPINFNLIGCKSEQWYYEQGEILYDQDKLEEAAEFFAKAFRMNYTNYQAAYNVAAIKLSLGKKEDGCEMLRMLKEENYKPAFDLEKELCN